MKSKKFFALAIAILTMCFMSCEKEQETSKELDKLANDLVGDYWVEDLFAEGFMFEYVLNEDRSMYVIAYSYEDDDWEYVEEEDSWIEVEESGNDLLDCFDEVDWEKLAREDLEGWEEMDEWEGWKNFDINQYDDFDLMYFEGQYEPYVGPLNGKNVTGIILSYEYPMEFRDTLVVRRGESGTYIIDTDPIQVLKLIVDAPSFQAQTRGSLWNVIKKKAGEIIKTADAVANLACQGIRIALAKTLETVVDYTVMGVRRFAYFISGNMLMDLVDAERNLGNLDLYDWMKYIDDDMKICQMSIPGTHDSFTYGAELSVGFSCCQVLTVEGQWAAGVRCFDVRVNATDKDYMTCHGPVKMDYKLSTAIPIFQYLLQTYPSETAIIIVKIDRGDATEENVTNINNILKKEIGHDLVLWRPDITLGEARGKIMVIYRFKNGASWAIDDILGPTASGWGDNNHNQKLTMKISPDSTISAPLWIQDIYEKEMLDFDSEYLNSKKDAFDKNMNYKSTVSEDENVWTFNATSGYCGNYASMNYPKNSATMAPYAEKLIKEKYHRKPIGIIMMDYAGYSVFLRGYRSNTKNLAEIIVNNNF